jgi:hypothetical protein
MNLKNKSLIFKSQSGEADHLDALKASEQRKETG